jgi:ACS family allantoate permease-like MFS transporter
MLKKSYLPSETNMWKFIEAIMDIKSWLFFLLALTINFPNGVFINFQGIIIQDMGFTGLKTTLMTMPSGAVQLISCVGAR